MMMMRRQKNGNKLNLRKSSQAHQQKWQPDAVVWPALTLYTTRKSTTQFDVYQINTHRFLDFMLSGAQMQMQTYSQRVVRQNCDGDCEGSGDCDCDGDGDGNAASVRRQLLLLPPLWSYHSATCHTMLRRKSTTTKTRSANDVNEAASKTKCRKSVMVMVIVWVSVRCCWDA